MKLEDVHIGRSPITGNVYVGTIKSDHEWLNKVDRTSEFLEVSLQHFEPGTEVVLASSSGKYFRIVCVEISKEQADLLKKQSETE